MSIKNYGVQYPLQSQVIKNDIKKTNLEKYGCENPNKNKKVREKVENTNLEKYGYKCILIKNK